MRSKSSEQWCCWIGRSLIIAGSAENRGNSCPSQQLINARASMPAEILALV
jgi:hypothetical protein